MADYSIQYVPVTTANPPCTSIVYHQPCNCDKQEGRLTRHKRQLIFTHAATSPLSHLFLTTFVLRTLRLVRVRPRLAVPATTAYVAFFGKLCLLQTRFPQSFQYGCWPNNVTETFFTGSRYLKNMRHHSPLNTVWIYYQLSIHPSQSFNVSLVLGNLDPSTRRADNVLSPPECQTSKLTPQRSVLKTPVLLPMSTSLTPKLSNSNGSTSL